MDYDLLLRGGRVVDGSGQPSYLADVADLGCQVGPRQLLDSVTERSMKSGL